jgi:anion-transporting  ArsA/GET3 family ATPase
MLDARRTFDGLVRRFSPTVEIAERCLENRYYQQISGSMVGSQEYMAMARLLDVREKGTYDLIVLDTPPSRHALDFLRAPTRLKRVLEEGVLSWLLKPSTFLVGQVSRKLMGGEGSFMQSFEKVLGLSMIGDLSEFVTNFKDLLVSFRLRAAKTQEMLGAADTTFVLVTSPNLLAIREAAYFLEQISQQNLAFGGFIINRMLPLHALLPGSSEVDALRQLDQAAWHRQFPSPAEGVDPATWTSLVDKLRESLEHFLELAEIDRQNLSWLRSQAGRERLFLRVPELPGDVHDLHGLDTLGRLLSEPTSRLFQA